jgi:deoxyribose-phosphate aldolase
MIDKGESVAGDDERIALGPNNMKVSQSVNTAMSPDQIAGYIDHTILKAEATRLDVERICREAIKYKFKSVCVNSGWVSLVSGLVKGSGVKVCSVVGFPLGAMDSGSKANEARYAVKNGADEIDMVINIGFLKSRDLEAFEEDIRSVREAAKHEIILKVIIETCLLSEEEIVIACEIAKKAGADFVKTSTGFSTGGATANDVLLMRKTVGQDIGVKASGGVRDLPATMQMIEAGATRIGTSNGVAIVQGIASAAGKLGKDNAGY